MSQTIINTNIKLARSFNDANKKVHADSVNGEKKVLQKISILNYSIISIAINKYFLRLT